MKNVFRILLAALLVLSMLFTLTACSNTEKAPAPTAAPKDEDKSAETASASDKPFAGTELTVFNWYDYIDPAVIEMFEDETGIKISYVNFTNNEEMYTKLEAVAGTYDVIFPSEYMIERMLKNDMLEELDLNNIPNLANVLDNLKNPSYDPNNAHSIPYMWGTLGILYNTEKVPSIDSWSVLFDTQYKNNVFMMNSLRDTIGLALKYKGYSMNTRNADELKAAGEILVQQKKDGLVAGYILDEAKDKMVANESAMAIVYSGDALYAMDKNEKLAYAVPNEGSNIWVDGMCIPKGSKNKAAAECFINFMCRDDVAKMNMDYIRYSSPIKSVVENLSEEDAANAALNPSQEVIARCEYFNDISDCMELYDGIWMEIRMTR
ncbi:MAG: spermidine/putrescine ABC transporter substrate-binding protein [Clostridiales bacterium]|nr:spermidine/putrescine ABC transporter substrate-binding protein [Clostridiales bacterium]